MTFLLPPEFKETISIFSDKFSKKIFERVGLLLLGTILTHGIRTVCSVLRTLGLKDLRNWTKYHRVLYRAKWSVFECSKRLLNLLVKSFVKDTTLVFGIDETLERRWGIKIKARGIYRDSVRSSKSHFVKCSGLRWICVMLLTPISWANRIWALPFLSVLAPSERFHKEQGKRHKKISDWARQISFLLYRWLPDFKIIIVGDGAYSVMELLAETRECVTWITRFRVDAGLYDFPPEYEEGEKRPVGRPRIKGEKQPTLIERLEDEDTVSTKWQSVRFSRWYEQVDKSMEIASGIALWYRGGKPAVPIRWVLIRDPDGKLEDVALQSTDLDLSPIEIVQHYLKRWSVEVTFEEVRAHLGVETQRQWSDLSILRTTPSLMALFSIVAIWADILNNFGKLTIFKTAWYKKEYATFSDALASIRIRIWQFQIFSLSMQNTDSEKNNILIIRHLAYMATRAG